MTKRILSNLILFLAMGLGLFAGWLNIPVVQDTAQVTSDLFLRLLKLISLPIIFLAVTSTITGLQDFQEMKKMGRRILVYTFGTTLVAAAVALLIYILVDPAKQALSLVGDSPVLPQQASYSSFVMNIIPPNLVEAFAQGNVMGVVFIALALSITVLFLPKEQKTFLNNLFSSLFAALIKMTSFIIALMPVAIWAFMVLLVKDLHQNSNHFKSLLAYLACVTAANLVQGLIILPLLLKFKKISPWKSFRGMLPALTVAFFSKSSNATLPLAIQSAEKNCGVSKKVANFSLPLCSVINMNGCAAFILTTTLFVSSLHGLTFTPFDLMSWIFIATFAAIGNAGVPMGCFFLTSAFLLGMDVPLYYMGFILPFYTLLDMIETTLNVWSDACIAITVDKELAAQEAVLPSATEVA